MVSTTESQGHRRPSSTPFVDHLAGALSVRAEARCTPLAHDHLQRLVLRCEREGCKCAPAGSRRGGGGRSASCFSFSSLSRAVAPGCIESSARAWSVREIPPPPPPPLTCPAASRRRRRDRPPSLSSLRLSSPRPDEDEKWGTTREEESARGDFRSSFLRPVPHCGCEKFAARASYSSTIPDAGVRLRGDACAGRSRATAIPQWILRADQQSPRVANVRRASCRPPTRMRLAGNAAGTKSHGRTCK